MKMKTGRRVKARDIFPVRKSVHRTDGIVVVVRFKRRVGNEDTVGIVRVCSLEYGRPAS